MISVLSIHIYKPVSISMHFAVHCVHLFQYSAMIGGAIYSMWVGLVDGAYCMGESYKVWTISK